MKKYVVFAERIEDVHDWAFKNNIRPGAYFVVSEKHRVYGLDAEAFEPVFLEGWAFNLEVLESYRHLKCNMSFAKKFEKALGADE